MIITFSSDATYKDVIQKGVECFFPDEVEMSIVVNSCGIPYNWTAPQ